MSLEYEPALQSLPALFLGVRWTCSVREVNGWCFDQGRGAGSAHNTAARRHASGGAHSGRGGPRLDSTGLAPRGRASARGADHGLPLITCEDPRPHAWSMCAACFSSCMSLARATPLGRSRYQTSGFPTTSEFPTELPTHTSAAERKRRTFKGFDNFLHLGMKKSRQDSGPGFPIVDSDSLGLSSRNIALPSPETSSMNTGTQASGSSYRGTWIIRNSPPLGNFRSKMPGKTMVALGEGLFIMGEVPLY